MPRNRLTLTVAVLIVVVLLLQLIAFRVRETERAVVKTFGKATRDVQTAGLYWKWPWPIEEVARLDARLRVLEGPLEETTTEDRKSVLVACFVAWRTGDPIKFLERHESEKAAERKLEALLRTTQVSVIGRHPFAALVAQDRSQLQWDALEAELREPLVRKARDDYAIEVSFVGLRRLALPRDTTENVFARMRAERDGKAKALLAEGQAEAQRIRDRAENERRQLVDAAEAEALITVAAVDSETEQAYRVFERDPELAIELRKIEALKRGLSGRTTLVFDMNTQPFDILRGLAPVGSRSR